MDERGSSHLTTNEQAALDAFITRLCEQYAEQLERVVLFGSKARGDADAESDLDVLVVLRDGDWRFRDAVALTAFEPMLEHGVILSPLVVDVTEYSWWQEHNAPIYRHIRTDGVDLWTKQPLPSSTSA
ncbi:MAG: nucleotidyltransferase domain-containing protein [Thermoflexales bacterium]|nr:nucleotidyltransferase domain-containing protein [Thermoflexales bacterium]